MMPLMGVHMVYEIISDFRQILKPFLSPKKEMPALECQKRKVNPDTMIL